MSFKDNILGGRGGQLFPDGAGAFFRRRLIELGALAIAAPALALLTACFGFDPADPSFNRATDGVIANPLGRPGAYSADLLLHSLGAAGLLLPLGMLAWSWRVLRDHDFPRWWLRLSLMPLALIALAAGFSPLPVPAAWPLESGLGGFVGELLVARIAFALGIASWIVAAAFAAVGLALLPFALGVSAGEWRAIARGFYWLLRVLGLGAIAAALMARSGIQRLRSLEETEEEDARVEEVAPGRTRRERREPRLTGETTSERRTAAPEVEEPPARRAQPRRPTQTRLPLRRRGDYELPSISLLKDPPAPGHDTSLSKDALEKNARLLETVLEDFGVKGEIVRVRPGPVVTLYELEPAPGTKTSRVVGLADDIARSMSALSVRVAVVPGSSVIGIELPNARRETVYLGELLRADAYEKSGGKLPLVLGKDIGGTPQVVDLARMPHLLIAGTTGSGKSVAINVMILSLLYRFPPESCKFIMIDPKMLELSVYDGIPHLLSPVVTDPKKAIVALKWTVREMEERYRAMSRLGVRNIEGYNARIEEALKSGETLTRRVQTGFDPDTGQPVYEEEAIELKALPFVVVVVDEMADLMLVAGKDIEAAVQRLAQMARAAGIHILMATQRPSVDVITGTIKANFPTRVSFHVTSKIDSRTILGETGAEQLLGQGDMLYMAHGGRISRVHGPLVTDAEVESVVKHLKAQGQPSYIEEVTEDDEDPSFPEFGSGESGDDLYDKAVAIVCQHGKASTSFIQRQLQIGYNRAARIIERMEAEGVVSTANHVGKREVLAPRSGGER